MQTERTETGPARPTDDPTTADGDYRVRLSSFQGPLDLLLYLIRRAEVDIHDIPIATITDQYCEFLHQVDHVDIDAASEFLVTAAMLIQLKSRTLAPASRRGAGEEGSDTGDGRVEDVVDPRRELVEALIAYQRYRLAAEALEAHRTEFWQRHPIRLAESPRPEAVEPVDEDDVTAIELEDAHLGDLVAAYARIAAAVDFSRLGEHCVEYDDTPIELHAADLVDRLERSESKRLKLWSVFGGRTRLEMIGLFLATLELARQRRVRIEQEDAFGEVELVLEPGDPEVEPTEEVGDDDAE